MKSIPLICAAIFFWSVDVEARSFRTSQYPNGSNLGCAACHVNGTGGGIRTGFGEQVNDLLPPDRKTTAAVPWAELASLDGDSDGYSNGLELGDPDGTWQPGDPNPENFTDPADRESNLCGDGILNGNEQCDGDPMGATCADEGYEGDDISCNSFCRLDFRQCVDPATNNLVGEAPVNNSTSNNSTSNNSTSNNSTSNNSAGNNATSGNNDTSGDDGVVGDTDEDAACSSAGATPAWMLLGLGLFAFRRRRGSRAPRQSPENL